MNTVRTFVGIPLDDDLADALVAAGEQVRAADPRWQGEKWVPAENLHVTLKFVGSVTADDAQALGDALATLVPRHARFSLEPTRIVPVPAVRRARMLWASFLDPSGACGALASDVEAAALRFGAEPDTRPFVPHATLVRARAPHGVADDALSTANERLATCLTPVSVRRVTLFASQLTPHGPVYRELGSYELKRD